MSQIDGGADKFQSARTFTLFKTLFPFNISSKNHENYTI